MYYGDKAVNQQMVMCEAKTIRKPEKEVRVGLIVAHVFWLAAWAFTMASLFTG